MIITKEQQERIVDKYVKEKHNTDECIGFIDGINATIKLINKLTQLDVLESKFHKPKKGQYTTILEFEVVKPQHDLETTGERLKLSMFGEYCPDASLRGYELEELLTKPQHYRPKVIIQMGETVSLNYA